MHNILLYCFTYNFLSYLFYRSIVCSELKLHVPCLHVLRIFILWSFWNSRYFYKYFIFMYLCVHKYVDIILRFLLPIAIVFLWWCQYVCEKSFLPVPGDRGSFHILHLKRKKNQVISFNHTKFKLVEHDDKRFNICLYQYWIWMGISRN